MKREDLLRSKEYWMVQVQNDLFGAMEEFMKKKSFNRTQLANEFGVSKGYITQVFNGDFDHKLSKLIELSLASDKAPIITFVDLQEFIKHDSQDKIYHLIPIIDKKNITFKSNPVSYQTTQADEATQVSFNLNSEKTIQAIGG